MWRRCVKGRPGRGFTLVELMVVIAVVGALLALLMPAVHAAREAARRMQCQHHLRQLGLAMHNYHNAHQSFPYGVQAAWGHSWSAHLLPYVEQMPLAATIPWSESGWWGGYDRYSLALKALVKTQIPLFRCPSQGPPLTSNVNGMSERYVTNYLACAGGDATHDNLGPGGMDRSNGIFLASRFNRTPRPPTRIHDVRDGLTHTLLISEAVFLVDGDAGCFICDRFYLYHPNADSGDGNDFSEALGSTYYPMNNWSAPEAQRECAFSSYHPGGVVGGLADGSVRFFHESIDPRIWRAMGSIRQREPMIGTP
jgi:prepilin-type N-terminal cleavage/methylation domain-containing protein